MGSAPLGDDLGAPPLRLCARTSVTEGDDSLVLRHTCTNEHFALPTDASAVLAELALGAASSVALAAAVARRIGVEVSSTDVSDFVETLNALGLLHPAESPSLAPSAFNYARAAAVIALARTEVAAYRTLSSNDVRLAPFRGAAEVGMHWTEYLRDDLRILNLREPAALTRDFATRTSSGSTSGSGFFSILEKDAVNERNHAEAAISGLPSQRSVRINRPSNLFSENAWSPAVDHGVLSKERDDAEHLLLTPGENPTAISDAAWETAVARILAYAPTRLEGDPNYLVALARYCERTRASIPTLRRIEAGHSFLWAHHAAALRRVFAVPVRRRYHSSEAGTMALECDAGNLHLIESYALYEIVRQGRSAEKDETGALVVTLFDSPVRPLIRYVLGDGVRLTAQACGCTKPFRVIEVDGRLSQLFRVGEQIVTQTMVDRAVGEAAGVGWVQFRIRESGPAELTIVPTPGVFPNLEELREKVASALSLHVRMLTAESLPATPKLVTYASDVRKGERFVDMRSEFLGVDTR